MSPRKSTSKSEPTQEAIEATLRAEAVALEQLRQSITRTKIAGKTPAPEAVAQFAQRQRAFLDLKIEYEKQKMKSRPGA